MSVVQEEVIEGYFYFRARIKVLEKDPTKNPLIVIFKGSESHGKNWSPDCKLLEETLVHLLGTHGHSFPTESYLLKVKVGNSEAWSKEDGFFRTDRKIQLQSLPTVILWTCEESPELHKTLEGKQECTLQNLYNMFLPNGPLVFEKTSAEEIVEKVSKSSDVGDIPDNNEDINTAELITAQDSVDHASIITEKGPLIPSSVSQTPEPDLRE